MSLIRTGFLLAAVIMLLPTDERRKSEMSGAAGSAVAQTVTFCERNPGSCAAGRELWDTFVHKAEFGLELVSTIARDYLARGKEPAYATQTPAPRQPTPAAPAAPPAGVRIEPVGTRGSLTRADLAPQWRSAPVRPQP